jgi:lipid A 3-O-deacylase
MKHRVNLVGINMLKRKHFFYLLIYFLALLAPQAALAIDSVSFELGAGQQARFARVGMQSNWDQRWWQSNGKHLDAYWDMTLAQWREMRFKGQHDTRQSLTDIGLTPVLRYQADSKKGLYAELGIGLHLLSDLYDNDGRRFSTRMQFGDHIGIGYVTQNRLTISLQLQHFSNGGIKRPNPGVLLGVVKVAVEF